MGHFLTRFSHNLQWSCRWPLGLPATEVCEVVAVNQAKTAQQVNKPHQPGTDRLFYARRSCPINAGSAPTDRSKEIDGLLCSTDVTFGDPSASTNSTGLPLAAAAAAA